MIPAHASLPLDEVARRMRLVAMEKEFHVAWKAFLDYCWDDASRTIYCAVAELEQRTAVNREIAGSSPARAEVEQ